MDVPASIDRIEAATIRNGRPMVNLSETLVRVATSACAGFPALRPVHRNA